jgi:hypothetical protein
MNNFESICWYDSDSIINNYIVNENSLFKKSNNKIYNFNKIIKSTKSNFYYLYILKNLKYQLNLYKLNKSNNTFVIYGKSFDTQYKMITLLFEIINEFKIQAFPFNLSLIEINTSGVYNFINNKRLIIEDELPLDFLRQRKYFDPLENGCSGQINKLKINIETNLKNKTKRSFFVFTIENTFQKLRLYLLNDLELLATKSIDPYTHHNLFLTSELSNLALFLLDSFTSYSCVFKLTPIVKLMETDIAKPGNFKTLFSFVDYERLIDLTDSFNYKITKRNQIESRLVIYKNPEPIPKYSYKINKIKPTIDFNENIYKFKPITPKTDDLNKVNNHIVKYSASSSFYPPTPNSTPTKSPQLLSIKNTTIFEKIPPIKLNSYNSGDSMEIIKFIPNEIKPKDIYDRLCVLNKFVFNSCVKNQLKLQKAYRNPEQMEEINKELITHLQSLFVVTLDQINKL